MRWHLLLGCSKQSPRLNDRISIKKQERRNKPATISLTTSSIQQNDNMFRNALSMQTHIDESVSQFQPTTVQYANHRYIYVCVCTKWLLGSKARAHTKEGTTQSKRYKSLHKLN